MSSRRDRSSSSQRRPGNDYGETEQVLHEAKSIRADSAKLTRESLRRLRETEDTAAGTMTQLSSQSEQLARAKRDLDLAKHHQSVAEENVRELKRLDRFFAFKNPFRSKKKDQKAEEARIKAEYDARMANEAETRTAERMTYQRMDKAHRQTEKMRQQQNYDAQRRGRSHRAHDHLLDDEDREMENEIDENLGEMSNVLGRLKVMGRTMGEEISYQNGALDHLSKDADEVNVRMGSTQTKLKRFS